MSEKSLNGLLGGSSAPGNSGSATVGGNVAEEGEIYIRADGKKVRRVKKKVIRTRSASITSGDRESQLAKMMSSASPSSKSGSASVAGDRPTKSPSSLTEGEVYIRADGKKVRRVKKKVPRTAAAAAAAAPGSAAAAPSPAAAAASTPPSSALGSHLSSAPGNNSRASGSATVGGEKVQEGEVYIRADGKKVRRVKKLRPKAGASSSASVDGTPAPPRAAPTGRPAAPRVTQSSSALDHMMLSAAAGKSSKSGSATVSGSSPGKAAVGEVYINKDGKKVRRVRKVKSGSPASTTASTAAAPVSVLDQKLAAAPKKVSRGGSATVDGSTPTKSKSYTEGEIYIRADGKKVRRVKRPKAKPAPLQPTAADNDAALSKMLDAPTPTKKSGASASVAGDQLQVPQKSAQIGEVYINKDGKKVRRVRKGAARTNSSGMVTGASGASSVAPPQEGEIYIRADGKKVRRVRKSAAKTSTTSINFRSIKPAKNIKKKEGPSDLTGFLNKMEAASKKHKKKLGSHSVAGDMPTKSKLKKKKKYDDDDNATICAGDFGDDSSVASKSGNKKKSKKMDSLSAFFDSRTVSKAKHSGSASVAGDRVAKKSFDGLLFSATKKEKKQLEKETELYRRDDGKLVRRVVGEKPSKKERKSAAGDLAGFLEGKKKKKAKKEKKKHKTRDSDVETVVGDSDRPIATIADLKKASSDIKKRKTRRKKVSPAAMIAAQVEEEAKKRSEATARQAEAEAAAKKAEEESRKAEEEAAAKKARAEEAAKKAAEEAATKKAETEAAAKAALEAEEASKKAETEAEAKVAATVKAAEEAEAAAKAAAEAEAAAESAADEEAAAEARQKAEEATKKAAEAEAAVKAAAEAEEKAREKAEAEAAAKAAAEAEAEARKTAEAESAAEAAREAEEAAKEIAQAEAAAKAAAEAEVKAAAEAVATAKAAAETGSQEAVDSATPVVHLSSDEVVIADSYRKMTKMGLPPDAVRHKMTQDGVDAKIIAAVMGDPWEEPTSGLELSAEEEAIAARYRKMFSMGLPEDAVRHKMTQDGVDPKLIASVLGDQDASLLESAAPLPSSAPTSAEPAVTAPPLSADQEVLANTYRKMTKMGLPPDAVRHKMTQDGVDAKIIAAVMGDPWEEPTSGLEVSIEEEAIAARYRKMFSMGLPEDAVRHKMTQDGVDPKIIASVLGDQDASLLESAAPLPSSAPTSAEPAVTAPTLSADQEVLANTYRKMTKMGLPPDAVRHKMTQDGVDAKIIASVMGDPWTDPIASASPQASPGVQLSAEEEAIANSYNKMKLMGLPEDAVRHKMTQDGVDPRIAAFVMGEPWSDPAPSTASGVINLSENEEATANTYRKMKKMGLPDDAVRHKMAQDGVDSKVVAAVFGDPWTDPSAPLLSSDPTYMVAVSDKKQGPAIPSNPQYKRSEIGDINPDEKFAVALDGEGTGAHGETKTKYLTLDDIAKMSGQSREDLEELVASRRRNSQSIPKFVLQPLEQPEDAVFEVAIPGGGAKTAAASKASAAIAANPALSRVDPDHLKEVKDGQEVVDSDLAKAARAVAALGSQDMESLLAKLQAGDMGALMSKLQESEKRQKKLEKQLTQAGVAIAEDIDFGEAKAKVSEIAKRMGEIGGSDVTHPDKAEQNRLREEYFKLEQEMERYNTALMMTDEYQAEQDALEKKWEEDNRPANEAALKAIRRHMPVNIKSMSESELTNTPSPNGKFLPKAVAKKFKRTNVLMILRTNPDDIERIHPAQLESYRVTGLTLTERRALYAHMKVLGPRWEKNKAEKMTERKWTWYKMMKSNFKENLAPYLRHIAQYGPPENHPYATRDNPNKGCPMIGKQCPVKANKLIDYSGDYGWTEAAEYEISNVTKADADDPGAKAMQEALELAREKKSNERADLLKKHYKGKLLQVSKANGSCEAIDESMDKMEFATTRWIEFILDKEPDESEADKKKEVANFTDFLNELKLSLLDVCKRSGMQTSGKKKAGGDGPDIRSVVECGLAEELWETIREFFAFIRERMSQLGIKDTRVTKTMELLEKLADELHGKNVSTIETLGAKRPERSRKLKKNADTRKQVEEKRKPQEEEEEEPAEDSGGRGPPGGGGGRGDLLGAIAGRGRGGGRGDLLGAIAGRGRGGRGGGRGDLLGAIAGRGRGGRGGGRGDLLGAIAGRGRGGRGDGGGGGRGGLLSAIQGRGGRGGGAPGGGGRGGLLAAIAARGGGGG